MRARSHLDHSAGYSTVIVILDADGRFSYLNDHAEELLRIAPDEDGIRPSSRPPFQLVDEAAAYSVESEAYRLGRGGRAVSLSDL